MSPHKERIMEKRKYSPMFHKHELTPLDIQILDERKQEKMNAINFWHSEDAMKIRELDQKSQIVCTRVNWLETHNGDQVEIARLERLLDEYADIETKIRRDHITLKNIDCLKWGEVDDIKWRMLDAKFAEKMLAAYNVPFMVDPLSGIKMYCC